MKKNIYILLYIILPLFSGCIRIQYDIPYCYDYNCDVISSENIEISEIIFCNNNKELFVMNGNNITFKTRYQTSSFYIYCDSLKEDTIKKTIIEPTKVASITKKQRGDTIIYVKTEGRTKATYNKTTQWTLKIDNNDNNIIYLIQEPIIVTRRAFTFRRKYNSK